MFQDITCDECACVRANKFLFCMDLLLGVYIMGVVEIVIGIVFIAIGALWFTHEGKDQLDLALRLSVIQGIIMLILGVFVFAFIRKDTRTVDKWLCGCYVAHVFGTVIFCIGLVVFPMKRVYYSAVLLIIGLIFVGYSAFTINSYRLNAINYTGKQEAPA